MRDVKMIVKFQKAVSKGSGFSQIYVPKGMEGMIEPGDEVEVRLVRKRTRLYYSKGKGLKKLSEFKENLLREVFSFLAGDTNAACIFAVGSFLTEKINYNDIDLVLITSKEGDSEESVYNRLIEKFNLKFHLLVIEEKSFRRLLKICPLTKAMFSNFVCNKPVRISDEERLIDEGHIRYLLMLPYDLLDIRLSSRTFFDSLRRLLTVESFLKNKSLDAAVINAELERLLKSSLYKRARNNEEIDEVSIAFLRRIVKTRLASIEGLVQNGKKQGHAGTH